MANPDILVAADETAATKLVHDAEASLGTVCGSVGGSPSSGSLDPTGSLGPFTASWSVCATFSDGTVQLIPPNVIRVADLQLNYSLSLSISLDLNTILPSFCLPQICVSIPFIGDVCTPKICISWPTITIPLNFSDSLKFTADFSLNVHLQNKPTGGNTWLVDIVIVGVPFLQLGPASAALITAIGVAAGLALLVVPFIGPFLAGAVVLITATIGIAGVLGFLGAILTPFISGLSFNVYKHSQLFEVIPASPPIDPAVNINLDRITAAVVGSDKNELELTANISAP